MFVPFFFFFVIFFFVISFFTFLFSGNIFNCSEEFFLSTYSCELVVRVELQGSYLEGFFDPDQPQPLHHHRYN